jgi:hypothetical protein
VWQADDTEDERPEDDTEEERRPFAFGGIPWRSEARSAEGAAAADGVGARAGASSGVAAAFSPENLSAFGRRLWDMREDVTETLRKAEKSAREAAASAGLPVPPHSPAATAPSPPPQTDAQAQAGRPQAAATARASPGWQAPGRYQQRPENPEADFTSPLAKQGSGRRYG